MREKKIIVDTIHHYSVPITTTAYSKEMRGREAIAKQPVINPDEKEKSIALKERKIGRKSSPRGIIAVRKHRVPFTTPSASAVSFFFFVK